MAETILSKKRYIIVALLFLTWLVGNFDRLSITYAIISITKEFHLNASSSGAIMSSFLLGYALMQFPGGMLADKFGTKKMLMVIIAIWSLFTIMTGFAWSFISLVAFRFLFGLSLGGFAPAAIKLTSETFPVHEQGKAVSGYLASGPISMILIPLMATALMAGFGWRSMFYIIGAAGFIVVLLYKLLLSKKRFEAIKSESAMLSETVKSETNTSQPPAAKNPVLFREVLKNPMVWFLIIANFSLCLIQWGVSAWVPSYLVTERHLALKTLGWVSSIPPILGLFSMLASGYVVDKIKKVGTEKILAAVCMLLGSASLFMMYTADTLFHYIIYSLLYTLFIFPLNIIVINILMKSVQSQILGKTMGLVNTGAQLGSLTAPIAMGFIIDASNGLFFAAFMFMVAFGIIGAIALLCIREVKSPKPIAETHISS